MKKVILNFKKNSKLHIGKELNNHISSDRLYSMIINALSYSGIDNFEELITSINNNVLISSAFLGIKLIKDNEIIKKFNFMPKPNLLIKNKNDNDSSKRKKYKKVAWISESTIKKLQSLYDVNNKDNINYSFEDGIIIAGQYYIDKDDLDENQIKLLEEYEPIKTEIIQRNKIDRYSKESLDTYYDSYNVLIEKNSKNQCVKPYFYFYIKDDNKVLKDEYIQALQFISIGGKRSLGAGIIDNIEIEECTDFTEDKGDLYINLSMFYPKIEELKNAIKYNLEERNGFIYSKGNTNIKKPTIRMMSEGSIFKDKVEGDIVVFNNIEGINHNIYVYGKALLYPFGGDNNEHKK
ncbi:MAG: type III-A CRISPR-associated RAMP protein Csm4 [Clostridium sp.]|nr:type III-A CRISPR-associated RAMP protein Csm4 [Clostridium sp.]